MGQDSARVQNHAAGFLVFLVAVLGQALVNLDHHVLGVRLERIAIKTARRFGGRHHQRCRAGGQSRHGKRKAKRSD